MTAAGLFCICFALVVEFNKGFRDVVGAVRDELFGLKLVLISLM